MSTSALIMMAITWSAIISMVVYLFTKVVRKEREKKRKDKMNEQKQQEQPKKESLMFLFILTGFYSLVAIGLIIVLIIYS